MRYAKALGVLDLEEYEVKPKMGDNRRLMKIMMNEKYKSDSAGRMDAFADWLIEIIKRDNPSKEVSQIEQFVDINLMLLFEDILVAFNWTTKEDMDKAKKESMGEIKK